MAKEVYTIEIAGAGTSSGQFLVKSNAFDKSMKRADDTIRKMQQTMMQWIEDTMEEMAQIMQPFLLAPSLNKRSLVMNFQSSGEYRSFFSFGKKIGQFFIQGFTGEVNLDKVSEKLQGWAGVGNGKGIAFGFQYELTGKRSISDAGNNPGLTGTSDSDTKQKALTAGLLASSGLLGAGAAAFSKDKPLGMAGMAAGGALLAGTVGSLLKKKEEDKLIEEEFSLKASAFGILWDDGGPDRVYKETGSGGQPSVPCGCSSGGSNFQQVNIDIPLDEFSQKWMEFWLKVIKEISIKLQQCCKLFIDVIENFKVTILAKWDELWKQLMTMFSTTIMLLFMILKKKACECTQTPETKDSGGGVIKKIILGLLKGVLSFIKDIIVSVVKDLLKDLLKDLIKKFIFKGKGKNPFGNLIPDFLKDFLTDIKDLLKDLLKDFIKNFIKRNFKGKIPFDKLIPDFLKDYLMNLREKIKNAFNEKIMDPIMDKIKEVIDQINDCINMVIDYYGELLDEIWNAITDPISETVETLRENAQTFFNETLPEKWDELWSGIEEFFNETLPSWVSQIWEENIQPFFHSTLPQFIQDLWDAVSEYFSSEKPSIAQTIWNAIKPFLLNISEYIKEVLGFPGGSSGSGGSSDGPGRTGGGGSTRGGGAGRRFADGGILTRPQIGLVGEAGPEAIIPLSSGRRNRGIQLWKQAGEMLGMYAPSHLKMGAASGSNFAARTEDSILGIGAKLPAKTGEQTVNIQLSVEVNPDITINGGALNEEEVAGAIKNRMKEIAEDVGEELAERLAGVFANMPVKGVA